MGVIKNVFLRKKEVIKQTAVMCKHSCQNADFHDILLSLQHETAIEK